MNTPLDNLSIALGSELPRRDVMKSVGAILAGMAAGFTQGQPAFAQAAASQMAMATTMNAVTLKLTLPSGHSPQLHLTDRHPGKLTLKGRTLSFVPSIVKTTRSLELSIYDGAGASPVLARRLTLPISDAVKWQDAPVVALNIATIPGMSVAALWPREVGMATEQLEADDCTVNCCWGGSISACAACCDTANPNCGQCCDAGCCPGCS